MGRIAAETRVPPEAPTTAVSFSGAAYTASASGYTVEVGPCPRLRPPYQSAGTVRPARGCDMASLSAGFAFGGRTYPGAPAARAAVDSVLTAPPGTGLLPPAAAAFTPVGLGHGVSGSASAVGQGVVRWRAGGWRFEVDLVACAPRSASVTALAEARMDVAWLQGRRLPGAHGAMMTGGSCGDATSGGTTLKWTSGTDVYAVSTEGYGATGAMAVAAGMRPWRP